MLRTLLLIAPLLAPTSPHTEVDAEHVAASRQAGADELGDLKSQLRDRDGRERRRAVEGLVELDTPEAWELVLDALGDEDAQVADEAQLHLGRTSREEVVDELLGKSGLKARNDLVRGRAAEAIGRTPISIEGAPIAAALRSKIVSERRRLCWSVERLCAAANPPRDEKGRLAKALGQAARKDAEPDVRAAALLALAALDPEQKDALQREARSSSEAALQIAALELAAAEKQVETATFLLASPARAARSAGAAALARRAAEGDRSAVDLLIEHLESEQNERLAWTVVEHLQKVTGRKTRRDAQAWRGWWADQGEDWEPASEEGPLDAGERSASFIGMPLLSQELAFLIDFSGSTWKERKGGKTRKESLDVEVRRALDSLPEEALFDLVPFTSEPLPWKGELTRATPKNVAKAQDWFEGRKDQGTGDALEAMELALDYDGLDTQVVLSDGAPSGGERWNLELIVPWMLERNRFRRVTFDVVLVDASRGLVRYWERLAAGSGGRVLTVDLDG